MFLLIIGAVVAIWIVVFWVQPLGVVGVFERLMPDIVYRVRPDVGDPGRKEQSLVALSFDDGPHPIFTAQVLDILQSHDAKATFFLIGERALRYPRLVAQIKAAGHEIGNHYIRDGATFGHSDAEFLRNLQETEKAIGLTREPKLFRAPGGVAWPRQLRLARENGYTCVLGCAYPHDPMHPPVWYIRWLIEKNLVPGTIIILHDGISDATRSIRALPHILMEGRRRGLKFVSAGELMNTFGGAKQES